MVIFHSYVSLPEGSISMSKMSHSLDIQHEYDLKCPNWAAHVLITRLAVSKNVCTSAEAASWESSWAEKSCFLTGLMPCAHV